MCPPDQPEDDSEEAVSDATNDDAESPREPNKVVGPLTEEELQAGGLDRVVAYIRTKRSKASIRKDRQRKKQQTETGKRQMNIMVPDNERSRATMRGIAVAINDEVVHEAFETILAKPDLASLITDVADQVDLREMVDLARSMGDQRPCATAQLLDATKLVAKNPEIIALMKRVTATSVAREAVEAAVSNPELLSFGRIVATRHGFWAWLARMLLRIRL